MGELPFVTKDQTTEPLRAQRESYKNGSSVHGVKSASGLGFATNSANKHKKFETIRDIPGRKLLWQNFHRIHGRILKIQ